MRDREETKAEEKAFCVRIVGADCEGKDGEYRGSCGEEERGRRRKLFGVVFKKKLVEDHGGCEVFWSSSGLLAKQQVCVQVGRRQRFQSRRRCHSFVCQ